MPSPVATWVSSTANPVSGCARIKDPTVERPWPCCHRWLYRPQEMALSVGAHPVRPCHRLRGFPGRSRWSGTFLRWGILLGMTLLLKPLDTKAQEMEAEVDSLSLESLLDIEISAASKYDQTTREAPASVSVITSEDIRRYGYRTLAEVLNSLRGFYTSYDRNYAYVGVRGFGRPTDYNNRVLLLINGHTMNEGLYGGMTIDTIMPLNLDRIERIEVIRGPGSALYGTGAMFGVINVVTLNQDRNEQVEISGLTGTLDHYEGAFSLQAVPAHDLTLHLQGRAGDVGGPDRLYYAAYDDPATNNGIAVALDWDRFYQLSGAVSYRGWTIQGWNSWRKKGIPTGAWEAQFNTEQYSQDEARFIEGKYERVFSPQSSLMARAYLDEYDYFGKALYEIQTFDRSVTRWAGSEVQFRWDSHASNRLILGSEYQNTFRAYYEYWDTTAVYSTIDAPFDVFSLYLQDAWQATPEVGLTFGLRHDQYSHVGGTSSPRLALVYTPSIHSALKLLYGSAFRAPNGYELFFDQPDAGFKPNPNLKPERIRTLELVGEHQFSTTVAATVSLFRNRMRGLIDPVTDPDDGLTFNRNLGQVLAQGIEAEAQLRTSSGGHAALSYTWQHTDALNPHRTLSNSPHHLLKGHFTVPLFQRMYLSTEWHYESRRLTVQDTYTKPFLWTNLTLTTSSREGHWRGGFQVRNVLDARYRLPGGFEHLQDAIEQDGRTASVKLSYTL